jgi:hypothetical protein
LGGGGGGAVLATLAEHSQTKGVRKFAARVNDRMKFAIGINDTGGKFATGVNDTGVK